MRKGIKHASILPFDGSVEAIVSLLGNGSEISCQDTLPFCLWCAARHLDDFEEAMWTTVAGLGDRDTTCAIVSGIVVMSTQKRIPAVWKQSRERLYLAMDALP